LSRTRLYLGWVFDDVGMMIPLSSVGCYPA